MDFKSFYNNLIKLNKNCATSNAYEVSLENMQLLKIYDSIECHIVLYPYNRKISSEDFQINPFREYAKDINENQQSAYFKIKSGFNEFFGLFLGLIITILFLIFKPENLISIEAIVSIFAVYAIGKELWDDIERGLLNLTKNWRIKYTDNYYNYELGKGTTLTNYSLLAKKRRYQKSALLPIMMDFNEQSNSQTVKMLFDENEIKKVDGDSAHILSIHFKPDIMDKLEKYGYLFGIKISFNKSFFGINKSVELFQSIDGKNQGCLDEKGGWKENAVFYRKTFRIKRLKYFKTSGVFYSENIISKD